MLRIVYHLQILSDVLQAAFCFSRISLNMKSILEWNGNGNGKSGLMRWDCQTELPTACTNIIEFQGQKHFHMLHKSPEEQLHRPPQYSFCILHQIRCLMALWVQGAADCSVCMHGRAAGLEELFSAGDTLQYSAITSLLFSDWNYVYH